MPLLDKIASGDMEAFEHLFKELYPVMCGVANRYLNNENQSKDIAQEAFIRLWGKKDEFDTIHSLKAFLYTTVRNLCYNYIRDRVKYIVSTEKLPENYEEGLKTVILEEETITLLYAAIDKLPPQSSRIILMSIRGLKNQEIADALGISVNSVKTLKYNAFKTLKKELKDIFIVLFILLRFNV